jgi:hypothetical protein
MKSYTTFRRHPLGEVVPHVNDDRHPMAVVPYGKFGAGLWTGHPVGLVIVIGMLVVGLVGIPEWRWFFGATVIAGSLLGYLLWRRHQALQVRAQGRIQNTSSCQRRSLPRGGV